MEDKKQERLKLKNRSGATSKKKLTPLEKESATDANIVTSTPPLNTEPQNTQTPILDGNIENTSNISSDDEIIDFIDINDLETIPKEIKNSISDEAPNIRDYAMGNTEIKSDSGAIPDIPEPEQPKQIIDIDADRKQQEEDKTKDVTEKDKKGNKVINPELSDLNPSEKRKAAELLAQSIIDGYIGLLMYAKEWTKLTPDKLKRKAAKGKFDMALVQFKVRLSEIDTVDGEIKLGDYLNLLNESLDENIGMLDEEKAEAKELLINILSKKGLGLTDEQRLLMIAGMNLFRNLKFMYQIKQATNEILEQTTEQFKQVLAQNEIDKEQIKRDNNELLKQRNDLSQQQDTLSQREKDFAEREKWLEDQRIEFENNQKVWAKNKEKPEFREAGEVKDSKKNIVITDSTSSLDKNSETEL